MGGEASKRAAHFRQKESLGEYGSGWGWDGTDVSVIDQTSIYRTVRNTNTGLDEIVPDSTPIRYMENGTKYGYCYDDVNKTNGQILNSGSFMSMQESCKSNVENAGNWYSWSASTAGGYSSSLELNSICPRGWQLTTSIATNSKSFNHLIRVMYGVVETDNDTNIRLLPISFVRSGYYSQGSLNGRGSFGLYWSAMGYDSTNAYVLRFYSALLIHQYGYNKNSGISVRCVSR